MRNHGQLVNDFLPIHERAWEASLFIDEAIKAKAEYALECIARSLMGVNDVIFDYAQSDLLPFEHIEHIESDKNGWVTKTTEHRIRARMREFVFYGNSRVEIWIKIIDFWMGKQTIFPCGGAQAPNRL